MLFLRLFTFSLSPGVNSSKPTRVFHGSIREHGCRRNPSKNTWRRCGRSRMSLDSNKTPSASSQLYSPPDMVSTRMMLRTSSKRACISLVSSRCPTSSSSGWLRTLRNNSSKPLLLIDPMRQRLRKVSCASPWSFRRLSARSMVGQM